MTEKNDKDDFLNSGRKSEGFHSHGDEFHRRSDVDTERTAQHHTLGTGPFQAAPGNHNHDGRYYTKEEINLFNYLASLNREPIGVIKMWPTAVPPPGYLLCDGAAFSGVDYPDLNLVLGGTNTPDFRDLAPVGASGTKALLSAGGAATAALPNHAHTNPNVNGATADPAPHLVTVAGANAAVRNAHYAGHVHTQNPTGNPTTNPNIATQSPYRAINFIIKAKHN